jgi:hypothetical protein
MKYFTLILYYITLTVQGIEVITDVMRVIKPHATVIYFSYGYNNYIINKIIVFREACFGIRTKCLALFINQD